MSNLLNKLRETKMETAKRIGAVALAGALVVGGTTACTPQSPNNPNNPNIGGTTASQETGKYSNLLTSVLNDEYYKSVKNSHTTSDWNHPIFDAHPFAFLEDQGIDVNKILDGTYKAETMSFVFDDEPNNLYINTRILIDDSYYQTYLLTYQLSDKEMADYKLVHGNNKVYSYSWPAFFINDKISEIKEPSKVLSSQYTKKTHEVFQKRAEANPKIQRDYILPLIDTSSDTYIYLDYQKHYHNDIPTETKNIWQATFKERYMTNSNGIIEIPNNFDNATCLEKEYKNATTFDLHDATIFRGKAFEALSE